MKFSKKIVLPVALSALGAFQSHSLYAQQRSFYLELDGIAGSSAAPGHEKHIDVLSWSWQASRQVTVGGTGGSSQPAIYPISIAMDSMDKSTIQLFQAVLDINSLITQATLHIDRACNGSIAERDIRLFDVSITSFQPGGAQGGPGEVLVDYITLAFKKICFLNYNAPPGSCTVNPGIEVCYNIETNQFY